MSKYVEKPVPYRDAAKILCSRFNPVSETMEAPSWKAVGMVLAEDARAPRDVPPRPRSAYDGYAVRSEDTPGRLRLVGESVLGAPRGELRVGPGEAAYITTGAYLPEGADAVVPEEEVKVEGEYIVVERKYPKWANVDPPGVFMKAGDVVLPKGSVVTVYDVVSLLEAGVTRVKVYRRVRAVLLIVGSELFRPLEPSEAWHRISEGEVAETTSMLLEWAVKTMTPWVEVVDEVLLPDDVDAVAWYVEKALRSADLVLTTGGTGPGKTDFVYALAKKLGGEVLFRGVAMRGGKPTTAISVDGKPVVGLSGYPTSALHAFVRVLYPFLKHLGRAERAPAATVVPARMAVEARYARPKPIKVVVERRGGELWATPLPEAMQLTSALVGLGRADGIALVEAKEYRVGDLVDVLLYREPR